MNVPQGKVKCCSWFNWTRIISSNSQIKYCIIPNTTWKKIIVSLYNAVPVSSMRSNTNLGTRGHPISYVLYLRYNLTQVTWVQDLTLWTMLKQKKTVLIPKFFIALFFMFPPSGSSSLWPLCRYASP